MSSIILRDFAEFQSFVSENSSGEGKVNTGAVITCNSSDAGCTFHADLDHLTEAEAGEFCIDECDLDRAYEVLRTYVQEKNEPERELFHDVSPDLFDDEGFESDLNELVAVQERMAKGMKLIEQANKEISLRFEKLPWFGKLYRAWAGKLEQWEADRFLKDPRNKGHIKWLDYRKKLWDLWNSLKEKSASIARNSYLWPAYFELCEFEFNRYFTSGEIDEDIDDKALWSAHLDRGVDLAWDHIRQMNTEELYINAPIQSWEEPFIRKARGCLTRHWMKGDRGNPLNNKRNFYEVQLVEEDVYYINALLNDVHIYSN